MFLYFFMKIDINLILYYILYIFFFVMILVIRCMYFFSVMKIDMVFGKKMFNKCFNVILKFNFSVLES